MRLPIISEPEFVKRPILCCTVRGTVYGTGLSY